jgi:hypothetical protein
MLQGAADKAATCNVRVNYSFLREHGGATGSVFFMHLNPAYVRSAAVKPHDWRVFKKLLYW